MIELFSCWFIYCGLSCVELPTEEIYVNNQGDLDFRNYNLGVMHVSLHNVNGVCLLAKRERVSLNCVFMRACAWEFSPSGWHWRGRGGPTGRPYAPLSLSFSLNGQSSFACGSDLAGGLRLLPGPSMRDTGGGAGVGDFPERTSHIHKTPLINSAHTHTCARQHAEILSYKLGFFILVN